MQHTPSLWETVQQTETGFYILVETKYKNVSGDCTNTSQLYYKTGHHG